jgi:putative addiction module component (TIGR02574 family)
MLEQAIKLPPIERAELIEGLLASFENKNRARVDDSWALEAESRIDAYETGHIEEIPISKVFEEIERGEL